MSLPAHFHHVIELLRFRQGTLSGIFLSAGENCCVKWYVVYSQLSAFIVIASHSELENSVGEKLMMNCVSVVVTVFQFSYTAVFGAYTAFIFIRTGDPLFTSYTWDSILCLLWVWGFFFRHFWSTNSFFMPLPPNVIWFTVGGNDLFLHHNSSVGWKI